MATCQVLDTIEEVNEDSQVYPNLDFGETELEAADLCEILEENSDIIAKEPLIDLATDQTDRLVLRGTKPMLLGD